MSVQIQLFYRNMLKLIQCLSYTVYSCISQNMTTGVSAPWDKLPFSFQVSFNGLSLLPDPKYIASTPIMYLIASFLFISYVCEI